MPNARLTLYDIIVDLLPGIIALVFLFPLLPAPWVSGMVDSGFVGLQSTILLLALGYVSGRSIHAVAARCHAKCLSRHFDRFIIFFGLVDERTKRIAAVGEDREPRVRTRLRHLRGASNRDGESNEGPSGVWMEQAVATELLDAMADDLAGVTRLALSDVEFDEANTPSEMVEDDFTYLEHYGQSLLYGSSSFYQKYTILTTFYRNLWAISGGLFLAYLVHAIVVVRPFCPLFIPCYRSFLFEVVKPGLTGSVGLLLIFLIGMFIFAARRLEFKYREVRTMINELHHYYNDR